MGPGTSPGVGESKRSGCSHQGTDGGISEIVVNSCLERELRGSRIPSSKAARCAGDNRVQSSSTLSISVRRHVRDAPPTRAQGTNQDLRLLIDSTGLRHPSFHWVHLRGVVPRTWTRYASWLSSLEWLPLV